MSGKVNPKYFEKMVLSLVVEALDVKRILFDNGFQEAHNRVAEAEAELRKAANIIRNGGGDAE